MTGSKILMGPFHRETAVKLYDELHAVIHRYDGQLLAVEVLGIMEILKHNIINVAMEDEDD